MSTCAEIHLSALNLGGQVTVQASKTARRGGHIRFNTIAIKCFQKAFFDIARLYKDQFCNHLYCNSVHLALVCRQVKRVLSLCVVTEVCGQHFQTFLHFRGEVCHLHTPVHVNRQEGASVYNVDHRCVCVWTTGVCVCGPQVCVWTTSVCVWTTGVCVCRRNFAIPHEVEAVKSERWETRGWRGTENIT